MGVIALQQNIIFLADLHGAGLELFLWFGIIASTLLVHIFWNAALCNRGTRKQAGTE
jgi:hypothetical protein